MNELSLFSGYAGLSLGLRLTRLDIQTVAYMEIDPYCQKVLKARIQDGYLDDAPIFPDIRAFNGEQCRGLVDIITAGFPCQPHSNAGERKGETDPRNLWPDTLRVIGEVRPRWVLLENVPGITHGKRRYSSTVIGDLSAIGYDSRWGLVSAAAVGAPHLRWRWWCLAWHSNGIGQQEQEAGTHVWEGTDAHSNGVGNTANARSEHLLEQRGRSGRESGQGAPEPGGNGPQGPLANPLRIGRHRGSRVQEATGATGLFPAEGDSGLENTGYPVRQGAIQEEGGPGWWSIEPEMGRVAYGIAHRVDSLKTLGNGVVPAVVAEFLRLINRGGK